MHPSKRFLWFFALAAIIAVTAACGGAAEEAPMEEATPAEEEAPAPEPEETPPPVMEEPEPEEPAAPTLTGDIVEVGEGAMDWYNAATREEPGRYWWQVQLRNDTTQTLDLTVTWQFLDENDGEIKTDRETVRVSPADTGTFRGEGELERDAARSVAGYTYYWDWEIVESN